jgi:probable F420-dependent oxidoreductase
MPTQRPFRFGVVSHGAASRDEWYSQARKAEHLGYATFLVNDHLASTFAPVPAIIAAAEATTTLRVGSYVFANDFRHPVMLAKEAATIDVLSNGRFEFGIGSGWAQADYTQSGIPLDSAGVRVSRVAEAVRIIKGAFADARFNFTGTHYQVQDLQGSSKPLQRPHPPLLIGGGSQRMLSIAAQEADIVGINVKTTATGGFDVSSLTAEATDQKVAWVQAAAGARFAALELSVLVPFVAVTEKQQEVAARYVQDWGIAEYMTPQQLLESPHSVIGSIDQIIERLQAHRERYTCSYFVIHDHNMELFAPIVAQLTGM